jgi:predicted AlkP superfamily pyrophosphatase or phosphodiesterase
VSQLLLFCLSCLSGHPILPPPPRPKLVVVLVIDQFRPDYLQRFKRFFSSGGFNLFLHRGASFTDAEYQDAVTFTCPGHAAILTGTYPNLNGIVANQWYDAASGRPVYCAEDSSAALIGSPGEGRSPRNLIGSTVGDQLKQSSARSRVITMAGKDRSAIMLGGHRADGAYWMEDSLVVTSTYYTKSLPQWVQRFNASHRETAYLGKTWGRLLPRAAYSFMGPDDVRAEENVAGMGRTFPHPLGGDSIARFMDAFRSSPFQNDVLLQFARAAVINERLGADTIPDLLAISFSANDLVGHAFGPDSHEVMDVTLRTDRMLADFFSFLDRRIGLDNVLIVLTADHGVAPLPEVARRDHPEAGRLDPSTVDAAAEAALRSRFGVAPAPGWILYLSSPWIYLNVSGLGQRGIGVEAAEIVVRDAVKDVKGVHQALTATELREQQERRMTSGPVFSFYPKRSGNVYFELEPFVLPSKDSTGTTHGSPWSYDTRVPLLWFGASIRRGRHVEPVNVADLAATLSALLEIDPPPGAQGRVLREMLR